MDRAARADAIHRLATYGTLAPGRSNAHVLRDLTGRWLTGTVRGHLHRAGWGAAEGFPGIVLAHDGPEVAVDLFESPDLPDHWPRLDAFEGADYRRVAVSVTTDEGALPAFIYEVIR